MPVALPPPTTLPTHEVLGVTPNLADVEPQVQTIASQWLSSFAVAAQKGDGAAFASLFAQDGFWRDILAFTNDYRTIRTPSIAQAATARFPFVKAKDFVFAESKPALTQPWADVTFLSLHFDFATKVGPAYGIASLVNERGTWKAYTVFTFLEGIHDNAAKIGKNRPRGTHNDKLSYDQQRALEAEFQDADPEVLIIGAGHNGLTAAAQLKALGVSSLVIDKQKRIGDNWRLRYKSLSLHDPVYANHLPMYPFPPNWPIFTPAGKLANFLESYVDVLELNVWSSSRILPGSTHDAATGTWSVQIERGDGSVRKFTVKKVILATGLGGGKAKMPAPFQGQEKFEGTYVHSSGHGSGEDWKGKRALVIGACTSAHDISVDFAQNGADVTMLQRSPTFVMSVKEGMSRMVDGLYSETSPPTDLADRIGESNPKFVVKLIHERIVPKIALADKALLEGLDKAGFQYTFGPDGSGFIMMALEKAGGYYFSTGGSEMIGRGEIKVKNGEIASFEGGKTVLFKDGSRQDFDVIVAATGYTGFDDVIASTIGPQFVAQRSAVWGLDAEGELQGVCRESGIPDFFFFVGNLSAARINSKVLALTIKQQILGIWGDRYTIAKQEANPIGNGFH
ncbi:hypothetical protein T439DRAFT_328648 [Meredithblackwellia eburnea MCA 4105]